MRLILLSLLLCAAVSHADEPVGTWRFHRDDRPVKVVVLGGSIGAWPTASFAHTLQAVCGRIELRNVSKVAYGAAQLRQRYRAQALRNPGARPKEGQEHWLLYSGGLNSIGSPVITIKETMETFKMAKKGGVKVVGFSLTPWGDSSERKWRDFSGLDYKKKTRLYADYLLGKVPRTAALTSYVEPDRRGDDSWRADELPDVAIDLYDSDLRDKSAALLDAEKIGKAWDKNKAVQAAYPDRGAAVQEAAALPQWFLRPELRSFDTTHPNAEGHKIMAKSACPKLPASWGCDCAAIDLLVWQKGAFAPLPAPAAP